MWTHYTIFGAALKIVVRPTGFSARSSAHSYALIFWWLRSVSPKWKASAPKKSTASIIGFLRLCVWSNSDVTTRSYGFGEIKKFIGRKCVVLKCSGIELVEMDRRFLSREIPRQTVANFQAVMWGNRGIGHRKIGLFLLCGHQAGDFGQPKGLFNIKALSRSGFAIPNLPFRGWHF